MPSLDRYLRYFVCVLAGAVALPLCAQSGAGRVQGTVRDSSGAVVQGASVSIRNVEQGTETDVSSDQHGLFVAPSLPIGEYVVQVTARGFERWKGHMVLRVNQTAEVDPTLAVGSDTQQVTVVGDVTPLVNTENQTIGATLDKSRIQELPENGRSISNLVLLTTPGIAPGGYVNGSSTSAFEYTQDGSVLANQDAGGPAQKLPDPDTIAEVKVETANSSAKFNRPSTAILTTKSGTNQLHGSVYETARNNSFGIAKARQDTFTRAPEYIRSEFGASVGGLILIPHLYDGRDKSFFFVSYAGVELRQQLNQLFAVPTDAQRGGDFSGLLASNGSLYTIYDPATTATSANCANSGASNSAAASPSCRSPFPGNQIPIGRISPLAQKIYAIMPHANLPNVNPLLASNLTIGTPNNDSERSVTARVDHHFSTQDNAFFRYTHGRVTSDAMGSSVYGPPATDLSANVTFKKTKSETGTISWTHVFSSRFFMESLLSDAYESDSIATGPNPNVNYASQFGLPNDGSLGFPNVYGIGFMPYGLGRNDNTRDNSQNTAVLDENFTYVKGNHVLQFGGRYRHDRTWIFPDQNPTPSQVNFSSLGTGLLDTTTVAGGSYSAIGYTGNTNASFFLGDAQYYQVSQLQSWYHFRQQEVASYFQDDWKVTPKLTLNLGIRWEIHPALHEAQNLFGGYDFKNSAIVTGPSLSTLYAQGRTTPAIVSNYTAVGAKFESASDAGLPSSMVYGNYHDIAPRVGFAYQLFPGKHLTVLRGGYGIYVYPPPTRNFYAETRQNPPYSATFTQSYTAAAQAPDGLPNYMLRSAQTIIAGQNSSNVVNLNSPSGVTQGSFGASGLDSHYPSTFVHQWNFTIEHSLPLSSVVRATYLGTHGQNLEQYWEYDDSPSNYVWYSNTGLPLGTGASAAVAESPYPNLPYGYIENQRKTGYSNDNSIQVQWERLHKNGYGFQIFYTLSNDFRNGGNGWRDSSVEPASYYLNGAAPADPNAQSRWANYRRDLNIPQHEIRWNWLVDLPVGRGKRFMGNSSRLVDAFVGGWRLGSTGHILSQRFQPSTGYYQPGTLNLYKKHKVQDCTSGTCFNDYLWFNGYLDANKVNVAGGYQGVPTGYSAYNGPLIRTPANGGSPSDPNYKYYDTNSIVVPLKNGSTVRTTYSPDYSPTQNWSIQGPFNGTMDASAFKEINITRRVVFQLNADFFNVLNMQGLNNPSASTGLISLRTSYNTPRVFQLTGRINW
ncbi:MAG TPA: TonB-dependent receptor [Granulicella sp.]